VNATKVELDIKYSMKLTPFYEHADFSGSINDNSDEYLVLMRIKSLSNLRILEQGITH